VVKAAALVATGVNAEGYREIPGLRLHTTQDGSGWPAFFRDLAARGLSGSGRSPPTPTPARWPPWAPP
jgi:transposase-like protein